jgi:hypothetical protein
MHTQKRVFIKTGRRVKCLIMLVYRELLILELIQMNGAFSLGEKAFDFMINQFHSVLNNLKINQPD